MRVASPRHAPLISVHVDTKVLNATVDGKPIINTDPRSRRPIENIWELRYWSAPESGVELALELPALSFCTIKVADESYGLPDMPGWSFKARPASMMSTPFIGYIPDATVVSKSVTW
jgi:hypothetical protein